MIFDEHVQILQDPVRTPREDGVVCVYRKEKETILLLELYCLVIA